MKYEDNYPIGGGESAQIALELASGLSFSGGLPLAHYKHRLLLMLDEFPSMGKLDILKESLAFLAGYGIKAYLICQDIKQLHTHYTRDEAITSNCHVQCAFPPNRIETAEHLSKLTGQTTVVKEQVTTPGRVDDKRIPLDTRVLTIPDDGRRIHAHERRTQRHKRHDHRSR